MEENEMEYTEAVEAAVSKRKYFLNSLFDLKHTPEDTSTEDDNLTYEARKRKFYESLNTWSIETFLDKICSDWLHMFYTKSQERISTLSCKGTVRCNIALNKVGEFQVEKWWSIIFNKNLLE